MARVFVAMSGGVDSSVAAALCVEAGHDVTGVTMQLWPSGDHDRSCCSIDAIRDARRVCDVLGIPHFTLNFRESFERGVIEPYVTAHTAGQTPNPCLDCNDSVKFSDLLIRVSAQGAEFLATGHYARLVSTSHGLRLARGVDRGKDQSYFLYRLTQPQMTHTLFPVGELTKPDVRAIATRIGLAVHDKPESQDVCFVASKDRLAFIADRDTRGFTPGPIVNATGTVLGQHAGTATVTVGQRHGLGLGGGDAPRYVIEIRLADNTVVVGDRESLAVRSLVAQNIVWHGGVQPIEVESMVRYRQQPVSSTARIIDDELHVDLSAPVYGAAPGQHVVCYERDTVIGGGVIASAS